LLTFVENVVALEESEEAPNSGENALVASVNASDHSNL
jgi:hypothetical protein